MASKNEWAELQDMLLALNIAAEKHNITYHYIVTSKFNTKTKNWKRLIRIAKFHYENGTYKILKSFCIINVLEGIKYATAELKEMS